VSIKSDSISVIPIPLHYNHTVKAIAPMYKLLFGQCKRSELFGDFMGVIWSISYEQMAISFGSPCSYHNSTSSTEQYKGGDLLDRTEYSICAATC